MLYSCLTVGIDAYLLVPNISVTDIYTYLYLISVLNRLGRLVPARMYYVSPHGSGRHEVDTALEAPLHLRAGKRRIPGNYGCETYIQYIL